MTIFYRASRAPQNVRVIRDGGDRLKGRFCLLIAREAAVPNNSHMKNWVISQKEGFVLQVGELFIQVATVEVFLERIYAEFATDSKSKKMFSKMTLGKKINALSEKMKIGEVSETDKANPNLGTRLDVLVKFRNKLAHNAVQYDKKSNLIYVKADAVEEELNRQLSRTAQLITDLYAVLLYLQDPRKTGYKKAITQPSRVEKRARLVR